MRKPKLIWLLLALLGMISISVFTWNLISKNPEILPVAKTALPEKASPKGFHWTAPDTNTINAEVDGEMIQYGRQLIANTSYYLGPKGIVKSISNGMNCQNCHLQAGTKEWGNNYGGVFSMYPRYRERSGSVETIQKRVNDCIERSLNGNATLDSNSKEMKAIYAYIKWLGKDVPSQTKPLGSAIEDIAYLSRAADPKKGERLFAIKCQTCHGPDGKGLANNDGTGFIYPPLWGEKSYTTAAGLYRVSRFAGYIKNNMPNGSSHESPTLSDEEAWDIAAFVNSQKRPIKKFKQDWPDVSKKPFDHPFGPYHDGFSEEQHKYGPFEPIIAKRKELSIKPDK